MQWRRLAYGGVVRVAASSLVRARVCVCTCQRLMPDAWGSEGAARGAGCVCALVPRALRARAGPRQAPQLMADGAQRRADGLPCCAGAVARRPSAGLAIYNSHILEFSFPLVLYKLLVGAPPSFDDLQVRGGARVVVRAGVSAG